MCYERCEFAEKNFNRRLNRLSIFIFRKISQINNWKPLKFQCVQSNVAIKYQVRLKMIFQWISILNFFSYPVYGRTNLFNDYGFTLNNTLQRIKVTQNYNNFNSIFFLWKRRINYTAFFLTVTGNLFNLISITDKPFKIVSLNTIKCPSIYWSPLSEQNRFKWHPIHFFRD